MRKNVIYRFFIGHNNQTRKPEHKKAVSVLMDNNVKGFSVVKGVLGYWEKDQEKSFIIEVISNEYNPFNDELALKVKTELEKKLKQYLVLTTKQEIEILA